MSRPWPNARSSTLLSPSLPSPLLTSVFHHWNFHRVQVELVESMPGMSASIELKIWLKIWSLLESVSYFLKGKNKIISPINNPLQSCVHGVSNISLLPNYPCNTCHSQSKLHFSLEKKYIYLYTPPKFLRFESAPILDRSKDVSLTIIHEWNRSHDSHWGLVERDSPRINMRRATYRIGIVGSSFFPCILPPPPLLCVSVTRIIVSIHRSIDRRPAN